MDVCRFLVCPSAVHGCTVAKRHPPLHGRGCKRVLVRSSSPASFVYLFCEAPPPFARLAGRMTSVGSSALVLTMHALPVALLVRTFTVFFGSLAVEVALCLRLSSDRTFRLRLSHIRTLLGNLRLFSRRGSRLALGFRVTGLSALGFRT